MIDNIKNLMKPKSKINLQPTICNLCGGQVVYTSNSRIYGSEFGSGKCYLCLDCGAYVGTHIPRPKEAFGILSNEEMRHLKKECHDIFDKQYLGVSNVMEMRKERKLAYKRMAVALGIPVAECHFGYFDMDMLHKAYTYLKMIEPEITTKYIKRKQGDNK